MQTRLHEAFTKLPRTASVVQSQHKIYPYRIFTRSHNGMRKRTNLTDHHSNNDLSSRQHSPPCTPLATSTIDLHEFASLLSEMLDPAAASLVHRKRRRRGAVHARVSFAEDAFLYPSDWTIEDLQQSWYTKNDLASFKKDRKDVVRALKRVNFDTAAVNKQKYCLRGYEPYFSMEMNKAVKYARELLYSMVFSEQKRQKMLNTHEPETIRDCSCNASEWARRNSLELGVLDSLEVFALTLNLDALSLQEPMEHDNDTGTGMFTGIILPESMSRQAKEQQKSQSSLPGAYHVDHSPVSQEHGKDTKMRIEVSPSLPGAYHVDCRQSVPEKRDEMRISSPGSFHMQDQQERMEHFQHALQFINY
jgi:hypothetical protein